MKTNRVICGDCIETMQKFPDNSFDGIVTDPPYGLGFMGKNWDTFKQDSVAAGVKSNIGEGKIGSRGRNDTSPAWVAARYDHSRNAEFQQWFTVWAAEALRIVKPGAIMLIFGGTRTYHRLTCAIEDAGWQIRDCMMWLYGSGFPKSHNISKAIDKVKGAERKVVGRKQGERYKYDFANTSGKFVNTRDADKADRRNDIGIQTAPATPLAKLWDGYGTALKPAWEPIVVAMKPLDGTFAANAEKWGVAGLNIDGGRIEGKVGFRSSGGFNSGGQFNVYGDSSGVTDSDYSQGRWPANLILDEEAAAMLDEQSGVKTSGERKRDHSNRNTMFGFGGGESIKSSGGASRFFYCAKASRAERNAGLEGMKTDAMKWSGSPGHKGIGDKYPDGKERPKTAYQNNHPTVKPLALMEYLCKLLKPPTEHPVLLDPFTGSGTTLIAALNTGWRFIGIEKESEYCDIARARIKVPLIRYRIRLTKARNK